MANTDPILTSESSEGRGFWNKGSLQVDGDLILPQSENEFTNPDLRAEGKIKYKPSTEELQFKDSDGWIGYKKAFQIAAMGDSMTANGTYVNELQSILGSRWEIINMGISGGLAFGMDVRFDEVTNSSSEYVIILGGVNDISQNQTESEITTALQSMYTKASTAGKKVIAMTILPFGNSAVYTAPKETIRTNVNTWIQTTATDVDFIVDIADALKDPSDSKDLNPIYDSGDGLHPNTEGYELIANTINSEITFITPTVNPTLKITKDITLDQDLGTFDTPTFRGVKANTIETFGTNTSGNPSISAIAGARNNSALFVQYLLDNQTSDPIVVADDLGNEYLVVSISKGAEDFIQKIYPQADDTHGILIKGFSPTYHSNFIEARDSTDVMIFKVGQTGLISGTGVGNNINFGNGQVLTTTTGVEISRNVGGGDTQFALIAQNQNIASTGRILRIVFGSNFSVAGFTKDGLAIGGSTAQNALQIVKPATGIGTITVTAGGTTVTGTNTNFLSWFKVGQTITANGETRTISAIASATSMTTNAWTNAATNVAYSVPSSNSFRVDYNGDVKVESTTANRILGTGSNKEIVSLDTTTYPSLTELAYLKGVTSNIQTQLDTKASLNSPIFIGNPTAPTPTTGDNDTSIATTAFVQGELNLATGWGNYQDTVYTSGSPFALTANTDTNLPNNKGTVIETQKPNDITTFYDGTKITGRNGDGIAITLDFKAVPTSPSTTYIEVWFEVGGTVGQLYRRILTFPKGEGEVRNISFTLLGYTLDTWQTNGAIVKVRANGTANIYDIRYVVARTHKAV